MAEDPSFYFNPFSPSWFGWTWRKVIPRVPIFVESRISFRQRGQLDIPFQAFYPCIAFTSPSDGRSLLDDDKSVSRKSRFTVFFSLRGDIHFYGSGTSNRNRKSNLRLWKNEALLVPFINAKFRAFNQNILIFKGN